MKFFLLVLLLKYDGETLFYLSISPLLSDISLNTTFDVWYVTWMDCLISIFRHNRSENGSYVGLVTHVYVSPNT